MVLLDRLTIAMIPGSIACSCLSRTSLDPGPGGVASAVSCSGPTSSRKRRPRLRRGVGDTSRAVSGSGPTGSRKRMPSVEPGGNACALAPTSTAADIGAASCSAERSLPMPLLGTVPAAPTVRASAGRGGSKLYRTSLDPGVGDAARAACVVCVGGRMLCIRPRGARSGDFGAAMRMRVMSNDLPSRAV